MKQGAHICLLTSLLVFLLISQSVCARLLPKNQGSSSSSMTTTEEDDMATLMGFEECNEKDEACLHRRMIGEAHLDYIYTQHNKPKGSP